MRVITLLKEHSVLLGEQMSTLHHIATAMFVWSRTKKRKGQKRLTRKKQSLRIKELRSYCATYLRTHRILAEYVDLIQGRIPKSVFARHYLKIEDLKELVTQVLAATSTMERDLLS